MCVTSGFLYISNRRMTTGWDRLRDYKWGALAEERPSKYVRNEATASGWTVYRMWITAAERTVRAGVGPVPRALSRSGRGARALANWYSRHRAAVSGYKPKERVYEVTWTNATYWHRVHRGPPCAFCRVRAEGMAHLVAPLERAGFKVSHIDDRRSSVLPSQTNRSSTRATDTPRAKRCGCVG